MELKGDCRSSQNVSNVNITAIDISKSSLAYALRKCNEYQINNAELFQCDILNIDKLKKF